MDHIYKDLREMTRAEIRSIEDLDQTTPFDRRQILDFFTKFKALCHLSMIKAHEFSDASTVSHRNLVNAYHGVKKQDRNHVDEATIGVSEYAFLQGLMECRMANQGILR